MRVGPVRRRCWRGTSCVERDQSIFAVARPLMGVIRLLASLIEGRLYLVCLRRRLRATMTGTEDLVTR